MSLTTKERNRLVSELNRTGWSGLAPRSVCAAWLSAVAAHGERTALIDRNTTLSYGRLNHLVAEGCRRLMESGVAAGDVVAIPGTRSIDSIIGILSITLVGAVYLPVDPSYPASRKDFMLSDARVRFAIDSDTFAETSVPVSTIKLPAIGEVIARAEVPALPDRGQDDALYIMYTSGSTGSPKGVVIPHRGVLRLVCGVDYVTLDRQTVMLQAAPLGFDASTLEIWGPLLNGGTCVLHDENIPTGPGLAESISRHGVTTAWLTAALFNAVVDDEPSHLGGLRELLIGGEALSVPHVRRALSSLPHLTLINGYGPTECTTFTTTHRIDRRADLEGKSIPIGRPITETQIYILDSRQQLVPFGETGELHVGGLGVGLGYLNRHELNAEKFLPDPFTGKGLLYRTGDLVRYREDSTIEFLGRADSQVKIRGYRIELGEIESALAALPGVRSCAVAVLADERLGPQLVGYVVKESGATTPDQLRQQLLGILPEFMVPSHWVILESLPVTANGKLDRRALPPPDVQRVSAAPSQNSAAGLESSVARALCRVLGLETIGHDENFFDHGGNSLLAVRAVAELRKEGLGQLPVAIMYRDPTVRGIAANLRQAADARARDVVAGADVHAPRAVDRREPIAIIGIAGRFPGAADVDSLWEVLKEGRDTITHFGPDQLDPSIPGELRSSQGYVAARGVIDGVENFDAAFFGISSREAELMDPQHRLFLELCWECLERGGHVPEKYPSEIGVFGGMYNASYFQKHVAAHPDKIASVGEFQVMLANEKDYVATRAAHKLNLRGPAVSVNTACSTSLVAIAQAVSSLRNGECGMALAGGVSVTCPPGSGYLYQEGAMLSPDGLTRTFDQDAKGTVFSDGGAVVLLKPVSAAIADGNRIYAVIRGVAVNNDGAAKASFTAPSVDGQAAVIQAALADAGIDARSISYIEAHGTATPLGDPVEIAGLTQAFRRHTQDTGFCRIGSLKSNMGHLVIAAGAAGVIKTALAMDNSLIPRSIHYNAPNPQIDFSSTPFVVADENIAWPRGATPRRAGVSSFGVGGTNAHVILEEAPPRQGRRTEARVGDVRHELRLSARTPEALAASAGRLATHLSQNPDLDLQDVAFTLDTARRDFPWRVGVIAADAAEAAVLLRDDSSLIRRRRKALPATRLAFMFPGQGAQYAGMGTSLHAGIPAFRDSLEECIAIAASYANLDLRLALFESDERALAQTSITQPATFAIEYALAQAWIAAGVRPDFLLGHSIGEFAAAVISGVMGLRDALCLVALRGTLMQSLPTGAMLSVRAEASGLAATLPEGLQLAAENSPAACVVSGPSELIDSFEGALSARGVVARRLRTSHAFHSAMMDPIVAPFAEAVGRVKLSAPQVPIVSTVTGILLQPSEAVDPQYWARHLRSTVRFSPALKSSLAPECVYLEVGPRTTLATLARQHGGKDREIRAVASLADSAQSELDSLAAARADLWCHGVRAAAVPGSQGPSRLRLPTYPFERQRHWVEASPASPVVPAYAQPLAQPLIQSEVSIPEATMPSTATNDNRKVRIAAKVRTLLDEVAGLEITADQDGTTFMELGLDSLSLTQVALQVKKAFGTNVTFRNLMESYSSVSDLAEFLDSSLPAEAIPPTSAAAAPLAATSSAGPAMAFAPAALVGGPVNATQIQLIQQQMALMAQQLALIVGTQVAVQPAVSTPAARQPQQTVNKDEPQVQQQPDAEKPDPISKYDVKKAFGAIARIHTASTDLSQRQLGRLQQFITRYVEKTRRSKAYTVEHRPHLADPRVVNGFRPQLKEIIYQLVIERSRGSRMWDLDGNEYVDALNGFGMSLFGWQPDFVTEAVKRQLDSGYDIGPQHPLAGEVAKLFCEVTGNDRAGLCNTGSEAVMGCVRIARTVTGRSKIAIFAGAYHGIFDEVIVRGTKKLRSIPAAPGIMPNTSENVMVLEYGTPESLQIIRENAQDLAAVLVEPVQSRRPDFQPVEFLKELRKVTTESGSLLIFDEVVTGFRSHPGGIQSLFGIRADICSYGKVVGGGFPIGVIAGKREFMDALDGGHWEYGDNSIPTVGVTYFAGTFVRHPLALVAAKAVLEHIKKEGPALQQKLTATTTEMVAEMNRFCAQQGAPLVIKSFASVWKMFFTEDHPLQDLLFAMMRNRNIHILDNFPCFMTTAHSKQDIQRIVDAFKEAILELQESEFLPRRGAAAADAPVLDVSKPPVPGARLGKDKDGNPAWFVTKPDAPGKYFKVG